MAQPITLTESIIPRLNQRSKYEHDRAYADYVYQTIVKALSDEPETSPLTSNMTSPALRIVSAYKKEASLSDKSIKRIMKHAVNIGKIQSSLCRRGTTADKSNFYLCWSLFEQGLSWSKIYDVSNDNCAWNSQSKDDVINKLKRMSLRFSWEVLST